MKEYCGISGIIGNVSELYYKMYLTLFSLQHRGQESAGITINDGKKYFTYKRLGFARYLLDIPVKVMEGVSAIGHVRYKTSGDSNIANSQPIYAQTNFGNLSMAHNGNLINTDPIKKYLQGEGSIFQGNSDTELILHLLARKKDSFIEGLKITLKEIQGAFSLVMMNNNELYGIRDPYGIRPLVYGKIAGGYMITSETCALDTLQGEYIGDVPPGNIIKIDASGNIEFIEYDTRPVKRQCIFEHIYFARPDSYVFGSNVHQARYRMGCELAKQYKNIQADIVVAVPDSGLSAALGFSQQSNIRLDRGIIRNHYVGRSFINPTQEERKTAVLMKLQPVFEVINGRSLAVIDDSLVRGTTASEIVKILKRKGAKKIHYFLASPPIKFSCFFGIDTPQRSKLIANRFTPQEMASYFEIDSVNYISINGLKNVFGKEAKNYCLSCFTGNYIEEVKNV